MADTYGVTPADVAAELPGIFPGGFSASTTPTAAQVAAFIATADLVISIAVQDVAGVAPQASDRAALLARQFIIEAVKARVIRIVYAGNDPERVAAAARPYMDNATEIRTAIEALRTQAAGIGEPAAKVQVPYTTDPRALVLGSDQLDPTYRDARRF
jgi:hypothetical protein